MCRRIETVRDLVIHPGCYFFIYFDDSCQNSYLKMYQTDLRQIFKIGRTMAVDDQSEISFSIPTMTLP